ncbi:MAG: hypothetical protein V2A73_15310 [Pseudomonadota bacterium]
MGVIAVEALVVALLLVLAARSNSRSLQVSRRNGGQIAPAGIVEIRSCTGAVDRCASCHLVVGQAGLLSSSGVAQEGAARQYDLHPPAIAGHSQEEIGCSACHGGTGRSLRLGPAHSRPGTDTRDPLMREPHIQASCSRCHVPGDRAGSERLAGGAMRYLELGCQLCHPLTGEGRGGWDYGPDLRAIGRKSLVYLETSLLQPSANFPGSTMPSFQQALPPNSDALVDLIVFLQSLVLPRASAGDCGVRARSAALLEVGCPSCHGRPSGVAGGEWRHRCTYLGVRRDELRCQGCHANSTPADPAGEAAMTAACPVIEAVRSDCAACHDGDRREAKP